MNLELQVPEATMKINTKMKTPLIRPKQTEITSAEIILLTFLAKILSF